MLCFILVLVRSWLTTSPIWKWLKDISAQDFSTPSFNPKPGLSSTFFQGKPQTKVHGWKVWGYRTFQPQTFQPQTFQPHVSKIHSQSDFQTHRRYCSELLESLLSREAANKMSCLKALALSLPEGSCFQLYLDGNKRISGLPYFIFEKISNFYWLKVNTF